MRRETKLIVCFESHEWSCPGFGDSFSSSSSFVLAYVDELRARGGDVERFAKRLAFFFYVHMDFFEEIAKFRAGRRLWARLMKERYGVKDPKAQHFRFGVVCGGSSLVAPQPYNNVMGVAVETMAAVFGGAQSIFTYAFDEAFQIPTEFSAALAARTQQIIAYESGIGRTVDPLGGSYFLEQHTGQVHRERRDLRRLHTPSSASLRAAELLPAREVAGRVRLESDLNLFPSRQFISSGKKRVSYDNRSLSSIALTDWSDSDG